jgi:hypothetical protein
MDRKKRIAVAAVVIVLLIIIFMAIIMRGKLVEIFRGEARQMPAAHQSRDASGQTVFSSRDTLRPLDTARPDTAVLSRRQKMTHQSMRSRPKATHRLESAAQTDSMLQPPEEETDTAREAARGCETDTTAPWVYTDPAGGLHHSPVSVRLFSTKPAAIEWKTGAGEPWKSYKGESILIEKTTTIHLQAQDSCGNRMKEREEIYELRPEDTSRLCPPDMERVAVGATSFCIDRYEWPNVKGRLPRTYVSVYQAMDTCASVGKRLCTSDEWTVACSGPYGWKYPYGAGYELYACLTNDTTTRPSGSRSECRGYFEIFDMSGNCAEWTSTKSSQNMHFYNVMGGFWESGPQSGCFDVRYSYFPQNRHNPVGFRCCKDALPGKPKRGEP